MCGIGVGQWTKREGRRAEDGKNAKQGEETTRQYILSSSAFPEAQTYEKEWHLGGEGDI